MIVNNFINTNLKGVSVETNETPLDLPLIYDLIMYTDVITL